jgi:hypothetical protein
MAVDDTLGYMRERLIMWWAKATHFIRGLPMGQLPIEHINRSVF